MHNHAEANEDPPMEEEHAPGGINLERSRAILMAEGSSIEPALRVHAPTTTITSTSHMASLRSSPTPLP
jgi:hypothetical protein